MLSNITTTRYIRGGTVPIRKGIEITEEDAIEYDQHIMMSEYFDKLQYVFKIKLNS
jgi:hypothetical protein